MSRFWIAPEVASIWDPEQGFPTYAWPGGYPVSYLYEDGGECCSHCVDRHDRYNLETVLEWRSNSGDHVLECAHWAYPRIVGYVVYGGDTDYPEDHDVCCDDCGTIIAGKVGYDV